MIPEKTKRMLRYSLISRCGATEEMAAEVVSSYCYGKLSIGSYIAALMHCEDILDEFRRADAALNA